MIGFVYSFIVINKFSVLLICFVCVICKIGFRILIIGN